MLHRILLAYCSLLVFQHAHAQHVADYYDTDVQKRFLTGKVKSIQVTFYQPNSETSAPVKKTAAYKVGPGYAYYDKNGYLTSSFSSMSSEKKVCVRDAKSRLLSETYTGRHAYSVRVTWNGNKGTHYRKKQGEKEVISGLEVRDAKNRITEMYEGKYVDGNFSGVRKTYYDEQGRKTGTGSYGINAEAQLRMVYKYFWAYDSTGRMTEWGKYREDSVLQYRVVISYDAQGREMEEKMYGGNDSLSQITTKLYNGIGKLERTILKMTKYTYETTTNFWYDAAGNCKTQTYGTQGPDDKNATREEYTWDKHGNKLTIHSYDEGVLKKIEERQFTYYE